MHLQFTNSLRETRNISQDSCSATVDVTKILRNMQLDKDMSANHYHKVDYPVGASNCSTGEPLKTSLQGVNTSRIFSPCFPYSPSQIVSVAIEKTMTSFQIPLMGAGGQVQMPKLTPENKPAICPIGSNTFCSSKPIYYNYPMDSSMSYDSFIPLYKDSGGYSAHSDPLLTQHSKVTSKGQQKKTFKLNPEAQEYIPKAMRENSNRVNSLKNTNAVKQNYKYKTACENPATQPMSEVDGEKSAQSKGSEQFTNKVPPAQFVDNDARGENISLFLACDKKPINSSSAEKCQDLPESSKLPVPNMERLSRNSENHVGMVQGPKVSIDVQKTPSKQVPVTICCNPVTSVCSGSDKIVPKKSLSSENGNLHQKSNTDYDTEIDSDEEDDELEDSVDKESDEDESEITDSESDDCDGVSFVNGNDECDSFSLGRCSVTSGDDSVEFECDLINGAVDSADPEKSSSKVSFMLCQPSELEFSEDENSSDEESRNYECDVFRVGLNDCWGLWGGLMISNIVPDCSIINNKIVKEKCETKNAKEDSVSEEDRQIKKVNKNWNELIGLDCCRKTPTKVKFSDSVQIYPAEDLCRRGPWETYALDRNRFQARIDELEEVLKPVLSAEHRNKVYSRLNVENTDTH